MSYVALDISIYPWFALTSKIGTKYVALKADPLEYLRNFGIFDDKPDMVTAEQYLVKVLSKGSACKTMDEAVLYKVTSWKLILQHINSGLGPY